MVEEFKFFFFLRERNMKVAKKLSEVSNNACQKKKKNS